MKYQIVLRTREAERLKTECYRLCWLSSHDPTNRQINLKLFETSLELNRVAKGSWIQLVKRDTK